MSAIKKFEIMFKDEFDDPNEAFTYFLLSLIPKEILIEIVKNGKQTFYSNVEKY